MIFSICDPIALDNSTLSVLNIVSFVLYAVMKEVNDIRVVITMLAG